MKTYSMKRQNFRLITIHIMQGKGQMGLLLILFSFDVVDTRPLPRDAGMAEDHGALETGKLSMAWTRGHRETESRQRASSTKSL